MHTRGLRMRSLGQVVKLSEKLSHVQSISIHEMIVRAFKHILQAVIVAVSKPEEMADAIAAALNRMLGVPEREQGVDYLTRSWLEAFLKKRYDWDLSSFNYTNFGKLLYYVGYAIRLALSWFQEILILKPFQFVRIVPCHNCTQTAAYDSFSGLKAEALLQLLELPCVLDQSGTAQSIIYF